jgi:hypothetical protein
MKTLIGIVTILLIATTGRTIAQIALPTFLEGTWKMENRDLYEHWDILGDGSMRGYSYRIMNGEEVTTEYLEISLRGEQVVYTAIVPGQNEGKPIDFILHQPDSHTYSFENPGHDFPRKIVYQKRSDSEIYVQVSDGGQRGFAYVISRIDTGEYNLLQHYFKNMTGTWTASPADSSFISRLEYKKGEEQFFVAVGNTLLSKTGDLFAQYEGVYVYNPVEKQVTFITITKSEIHTGACRVEGDTLFHHAHISGSGRIKSYSSAIVKMQDGTLHYYADYSESETFPELSFGGSLVYRRQNP